MQQEIDILKNVCKRLELANIPYMLTGSLASHFYTVPRMTRDIDIVIDIPNTAVERFYEVFKEDFYIEKSVIRDALLHEGMFNIIHHASVYKIDFIIRKEAPYRAMEFQRRRRITLDDEHIWIVSPEDLILSKLYWAKDSISKMQLNDVKGLLLKVKNLDHLYLEEWIEKLNLQDIFSMVQTHG